MLTLLFTDHVFGNLNPGLYKSQMKFQGKCDSHLLSHNRNVARVCYKQILEHGTIWEKRKRSARLRDCTIYRWTHAVAVVYGEKVRDDGKLFSCQCKHAVDIDNGAVVTQRFRATSQKVVISSPGKTLTLTQLLQECCILDEPWLWNPTDKQANKDFIFCKQNNTLLPTIALF